MSDNKGFGSSERDDFWDIEKLIPKKKPSNMRPFVTKPVAVDYDADKEAGTSLPEESEEEKSERKLTFDNAASQTERRGDESYEPKGNNLIKKVTIKRYNDKYDFYGNFRKAALIYYDYKTAKCDYVPFFSYMPQYSQLNTEQKNYYFYWRSEIRRGKFPKTDYSYLYLYVYEILNLPDKIPAEEGIKILCRLWREYRTQFPKINANFSVWIQDYCFIHRLECPMEELHDFMYEVIGASEFKEFYLSDIEVSEGESIGAMIAFLSDYDWRRGKFIEESVADVYKKHVYTAMRSLLLHLKKSGELYKESNTLAVLKRNAFPNSLCTHSVKCRLEIEYISLGSANGFRDAITSAVRYTENKIRALLGVKSRLAIKNLPDNYREVIDAYFTLAERKEERIRVKEQIPDYEKLYDAPSVALSFEGADEIERASWATTERLVSECELDGGEDEDVIEASECKEPVSEAHEEKEASACECESETYGLSEAEIELLQKIYAGEISCADGIETDTVVERINEAFSDAIGDVVIYSDGEKYMIYEDYTEEIGEWLLKLTK